MDFTKFLTTNLFHYDLNRQNKIDKVISVKKGFHIQPKTNRKRIIIQLKGYLIQPIRVPFCQKSKIQLHFFEE